LIGANVNLTKLCLTPLIFLAASSLASQQSPVAPITPTSDKPRVFITDSESWEVSGSAGGHNGTFASQSHGGARPQTAEIIKTFGQRCSEVLVNNRQDIADYIVVLDHEGGKGYLRHRNKVAVFQNVSGDVVMSKSTLSLGGSVEDACNGINQHWAAHSNELILAKQKSSSPAQPAQAPVVVAQSPSPSMAAQASVVVDSTPAGADIEIDGVFVGDTPSTVNMALGSHEVTVKKKGFADWTKKMTVTGGSIHLNAELEPGTTK
jgi:hypothetical protein